MSPPRNQQHEWESFPQLRYVQVENDLAPGQSYASLTLRMLKSYVYIQNVFNTNQIMFESLTTEFAFRICGANISAFGFHRSHPAVFHKNLEIFNIQSFRG
jgi:hypothetical protein